VIGNFAEQTTPAVGANGDKIKTCLRIIIMRQTDRTALVDYGIIFHIDKLNKKRQNWRYVYPALGGVDLIILLFYPIEGVCQTNNHIFLSYRTCLPDASYRSNLIIDDVFALNYNRPPFFFARA
jgi:hypothetical protein